jgi:hypothetical protein
MALPGALANLDHAAAIDRLANGTMLKQIAAEWGVSKVAVYKQLRKHPDYPDAIAAQAHSFVEDAMDDVQKCDAETVNIARARVDAAFKYAKAHNPDYRDQVAVGTTINVLVQDSRVNDLGALLSRAKTETVGVSLGVLSDKQQDKPVDNQ